MRNQDNQILNEIICPEKLYIPSFKADDNTLVQPNIKTGTVYVSYDIAACKAANVNPLTPEQIDQLISHLANTFAKLKAITPQTFSTLSLQDKKGLVLEFGDSMTLAHALKPMNKKQKGYFSGMMADINCHTGLNFIVVNAESYNQITDHYKIAVCNTKKNFIVKNLGYTAITSFPYRDKHPSEGLIAFDPADGQRKIQTAKDFQINTWSHEFMHALGLGHGEYPTMQTQLKYRSVMEEAESPQSVLCRAKAQGNIEKYFDCFKQPTKPTGQDFCALQKLYGPSTNQTLACRKLRAETVKEYPYLKLQEVPAMGFDL